MCKFRNILCILLNCLFLLTSLGCSPAGNDLTQIGTQQCTLLTTAPLTEEPSFDSVSISPNELELLNKWVLLKNDPADTIVKIFYLSESYPFCKGNKLDDILSNKISDAYYIIFTAKETRRARIVDGVAESIPTVWLEKGWDEFVQYALSPETVFGASITVYSIYCLCESASGIPPVRICYVTDEGTYVLHKNWASDNKIYLFPIDVYSLIEKAILDKYATWDNGAIGIVTPEDVWDVEPYRLMQLDNLSSD